MSQEQDVCLEDGGPQEKERKAEDKVKGKGKRRMWAGKKEEKKKNKKKQKKKRKERERKGKEGKEEKRKEKERKERGGKEKNTLKVCKSCRTFKPAAQTETELQLKCF